ncbi:MAG: DUF4912 domain-containing protein [Candidatus Sumerlaeia bacterium]|nr:DUF4912 domain-containing protein [Candidatus Sumerlaeia bacterium]
MATRKGEKAEKAKGASVEATGGAAPTPKATAAAKATPKSAPAAKAPKSASAPAGKPAAPKKSAAKKPASSTAPVKTEKAEGKASAASKPAAKKSAAAKKSTTKAAAAPVETKPEPAAPVEAAPKKGAKVAAPAAAKAESPAPAPKAANKKSDTAKPAAAEAPAKPSLKSDTDGKVSSAPAAAPSAVTATEASAPAAPVAEPVAPPVAKRAPAPPPAPAKAPLPPPRKAAAPPPVAAPPAEEPEQKRPSRKNAPDKNAGEPRIIVPPPVSIAARRTGSSTIRSIAAKRAPERQMRWDLPPAQFGGPKPELIELQLPPEGPWNARPVLEAGPELPPAFTPAVDDSRPAPASVAPPLKPAAQEPAPAPRPAAAVVAKPREPIPAPAEVAPPPPPPLAPIPASYEETSVTAMARDPEFLFVYWEISAEKRAEVGLPKGEHNRPLVLRLINLAQSDPLDESRYSLVPVNDRVDSWYVRVPREGVAYIVELGCYGETGDFVLIARSEPVEVPRSTLSEVVQGGFDNEYEDKSPQEMAEIYNQILLLSGGPLLANPSSADFVRILQQRLFSAPSSPGGADFAGSGGSLFPLPSNQFPPPDSGLPMFGGDQPILTRVGGDRGRNFWLEVGVDVIVYGRTEPDAYVTLMGRPVTLTPDGRFRLRMTLPDGTIEFPVEATSSDQVETRRVMPVVTRKTYD